VSERPVSLLSNDDGVHARGIQAVARRIDTRADRRRGSIAARYEQSARSHSITIDRRLRHIDHERDLHSIAWAAQAELARAFIVAARAAQSIPLLSGEHDADTDARALALGYASITPLSLEATSRDKTGQLQCRRAGQTSAEGDAP
jgi:broad specificity polyphosphatase/5'/3'-nucleotidase SurE